MKKSNKIIFFDLYQTLLDVGLNMRGLRPSREESLGWETIARELYKYKPIEADQVRGSYDKRRNEFYLDHDPKLFHHDFAFLMSKALEDLGIFQSEEEVTHLLYEFRKVARCYLRLYPDAKEVLEKLSQTHILAVASHTQSCYTQIELRELKIEHYFSYFIYSSDLGLRKESLDFYKKALEIVDKKGKDCFMVGDNYDADFLVPKQLGIKTIWIRNPQTQDRYTMEGFPEDSIPINELDKLPELIEKVLNSQYGS